MKALLALHLARLSIKYICGQASNFELQGWILLFRRPAVLFTIKSIYSIL